MIRKDPMTDDELESFWKKVFAPFDFIPTVMVCHGMERADRAVRLLKFWATLVAISITGCSTTGLTDNAVLLVPKSDVTVSQNAISQYAGLVPFTVTVTTDAKRFESWPTEERWQVRSIERGEYVRDEVACVDFIAVTDLDARIIWIPDCNDAESRDLKLAHELGHMVGASDTYAGVMSEAGVPETIEPSAFTRDELREIY